MSDQDEQPTARWTRERLDAYAVQQGVHPTAYTTKDDLVAALVPTPDGEDESDPVEASVADSDPVAGDDDADDGEDEDEDDATAPMRYRVLKAITLADGRTVMPGEEFVPDADFPARRPKQLVEQKFLQPID